MHNAPVGARPRPATLCSEGLGNGRDINCHREFAAQPPITTHLSRVMLSFQTFHLRGPSPRTVNFLHMDLHIDYVEVPLKLEGR